jgi:hypothetical protein
MKGINWNPVSKGSVHPQGLDFRGTVDQDAQMMADAGINVVRTYEPLTDTVVLDKLWSHGIYVISTVYPFGGSDASTAQNYVNAVKSHPAILMWAVVNEWNYNGLYVGMSFTAARARILEVVQVIKQHDTSHPVTTIFGELPDASTLSYLDAVDVWGINVYRDIGFGNLFQDWAARSPKPMYLGEYGADAYDARSNGENQDAQAAATTALTELIVAQSSVNAGGICSGGIIFEFNDEWWKDDAGSPSTHDVGGIAPGGGPHPDLTFNEEWWGLVDIDRRPRKAYTAYANVAMPGGGSTVSTTGSGSTVSTTQGSGPAVGTCEDVLSDDADGHTCGARITWMQNNRGMTEVQARDAVAQEFPNECGACRAATTSPRPTTTTTSTRLVVTCEAIWNNLADGYSCGSRIEWLRQNRGMTDMQARNLVATEFPIECGACRDSSPTPAPTQAPTPAPTPSPGPQIPSTPPPEPCEDLHQHCWFWSNLGLCSGTWEDSMRYWCRRTCDSCTAPVLVASTLPVHTRPALPLGPTSAELWQGIESDTSVQPRLDSSMLGVASLSARHIPSCILLVCSLAYWLLY